MAHRHQPLERIVVIARRPAGSAVVAAKVEWRVEDRRAGLELERFDELTTMLDSLMG